MPAPAVVSNIQKKAKDPCSHGAHSQPIEKAVTLEIFIQTSAYLKIEKSAIRENDNVPESSITKRTSLNRTFREDLTKKGMYPMKIVRLNPYKGSPNSN